ncbi:COG1361 family protein [Natronolimnobius baerhuensis]|uniref:Uncharacterized protein n=1 Tax=Natronolimnobius baerhuensis TaxID=253108 RepID=A0A202E527_9EURY|nr:hypothetical protein [Natronolimnobius baerhuensis]OVE83355.1 hypothetical protein B2G88_12890 [Natronolimnobius baerhuensis]
MDVGKIIKKAYEISANLMFLSFAILLSLIILNEFAGWVSVQNMSVIASAMGAFGTLMLAWFTFGTIKQNEKLIKHQQQQIKHQRARSRPVLRQINDFEALGKHSLVSFKLENIGEGTAYNIKFQADICIPELGVNTATDTEIPQLISNSSVPPLETQPSGIYKNNDVKGSGMNPSGGILREGSSGRFEYRVDFSNKNKSVRDIINGNGGEPGIIVFSKLLEYLKEDGIEIVYIQFKVSYEDVYGDEYTEEFPVRTVFVEETKDVSDLFDSPIWINDDGESARKASLQNIG